jgi:uncharacterized membrane protein/nitrite reductase/ring-hydroxylating ferredoxin subunit
MRSKAHIKGHPLHPILVSFPISLLTGALLLDVLTMVTYNVSFMQAGYYSEAAGLISALAAAVPGILDYIYTVPPESSAHKRATNHALYNSTAVMIFTAAFFMRHDNGDNLKVIIVMEGIGVALLVIAGWLGGTLVTRNQIGIDHRYAGAGKWKEETVVSKENIIRVNNTEHLKLNQMMLLRVNDKRIVIAMIENGLVAFDDHCSHRGGSLADGVMICGTVQCPWHGSQFDACSGKVKAGPAKENIKTYSIVQDGNVVLLHLAD